MNRQGNSDARERKTEANGDVELDRLLRQSLLPNGQNECVAESEDLQAVATYLKGVDQEKTPRKRALRKSDRPRRARLAATTGQARPVWIWVAAAAAVVLVVAGWSAMDGDGETANPGIARKTPRPKRQKRKPEPQPAPAPAETEKKNVPIQKPEADPVLKVPDEPPPIVEPPEEGPASPAETRVVEKIEKKEPARPDPEVKEPKEEIRVAGRLDGPVGAWQVVKGPGEVRLVALEGDGARVGEGYRAQPGAALRLEGGALVEVLDAGPALLCVERVAGMSTLKDEKPADRKRHSLRLYAGRVRITVPEQGTRLVLHCGDRAALRDVGTTYVVNVRPRITGAHKGTEQEGIMRGMFGKAAPVLFALAVTAGTVQVWEGGRMSVAHAAEGVQFTCTDVCSMSGCGLENTFYSKGDKAYVQIKYFKNAKMLGKRQGQVDHMIYDLGQSKMFVMDPAKRTYYAKSLSKQQVANVKALITQLNESEDAKKFLGKKKEKGVFYTFKTITTTVTKAEKLAKVDERKLSVPTGYREVKAPKGRRG